MGTAGLDVVGLRRLLSRGRIAVDLLEDDRLRDRCILRLTQDRYPYDWGLLCYENLGMEPRLVWWGAGVELGVFDGGSLYDDGLPCLRLRGPLRGDVGAIGEWLGLLWGSESAGRNKP
jgi:hypothetical protein